MRKALRTSADAVILDLEDAVATGLKDRARKQVETLLGELEEDRGRLPIFVRINEITTQVGREDLDAVIRPGLTGIKVPKVDTVEQLQIAADLIAAHERSRGIPEGAIVLIPGIESARGVLDARSIARASGRIWALSFGATDYTRDLGADPSPTYIETVVPLSILAMVSADARLAPPIDSAYTAIGDLVGLERNAQLARAMGFQGKSVIHPGQIETVNRVFTPSAEEVSRARRVVDVYSESAGAVLLDAALVDVAHVRRALDVLALHTRIERGENVARS